MENNLEMFQCFKCGNLVEIVNKKPQEAPVCCNHPMTLLNSSVFVSGNVKGLIPTDEIQRRILSDLGSGHLGLLKGGNLRPVGLSTSGMMYIHRVGDNGIIEIEVLMNT